MSISVCWMRGASVYMGLPIVSPLKSWFIIAGNEAKGQRKCPCKKRAIRLVNQMLESCATSFDGCLK